MRANLKRAETERIRHAQQRTSAVRIRLSALSPERRLSGLRSRTDLARERLNHAVFQRTEKERNRIQSGLESFRRAAERRGTGREPG